MRARRHNSPEIGEPQSSLSATDFSLGVATDLGIGRKPVI